MSEELEAFDPSRLMEGVRERIRATFVSLIPEDRWAAMVKEVIDEFMHVKRDTKYHVEKLSNGYVASRHTEASVTAFQALVFEELVSVVRPVAKAVVAEWSNMEYNQKTGRVEANAMITAWLTENAQTIVAYMFREAFAGLMQQLQYRT